MRESVKKALLQMYRNLEQAARLQAYRGIHDQGARSQVTSGKHLNVLAKEIRKDLISAGYAEEDTYYENGCLKLPGWFRPSKDWDMLAFDGDDLLGIIELKSINSSFGNNANNRAEESIGSAVDAAHAIKNQLIPFCSTPPLLGYVLVVKICEDSTKAGRRIANSVFPVDESFQGVSYFERLTILCRRLLSERLYQAIWIVGVDPDKGTIIEPDPDLTYDKFIAAYEGQLRVHRA